MKTTELSQFTNKELKDILKKNQVKNYSKLNKKDLFKMVNQLINSQKGGNEKEPGQSNDPFNFIRKNLVKKGLFKNPDQSNDPFNSIGNILVKKGLLKHRSREARLNSRQIPVQHLSSGSSASEATAPQSMLQANLEPRSELQKARNMLQHRQRANFNPRLVLQEVRNVGTQYAQANLEPGPALQEARSMWQRHQQANLEPRPALLKARNMWQRHQQANLEPGPALLKARNMWQHHQQANLEPGPALLKARNMWQRHQQANLEPGPALLKARNMWQRRQHSASPLAMLQSRPRNAVHSRGSNTCPSPGWDQQRNDCWIDSAYYSMFVPSNLQDWFFTFLANISSSEYPELIEFSRLSIEYLKGIDGNPDFLLRKQELKRNILRSIKQACEGIDPGLYNSLNALARVPNLFASNGIANVRGNGDVSIFFKFISIIQPRLWYSDMPNWVELLKRSNGNKVIQKHIRDELRKIRGNPNIDIVTINASYAASEHAINRQEVQFCRADNTVLQEILDINDFTLEAVIRGDNVHYTVDFKCSDNKWYNYDNQTGPNHIREIDPRTRNWQGQDGLIFIFRRRS